jgi:hypothetical protein
MTKHKPAGVAPAGSHAPGGSLAAGCGPVTRTAQGGIA